MMRFRYLAGTEHYDGSQLRAHWILDRTGLIGDALVAFRGSCDVILDEVADLADLDGPGIRGADMLHFLVEVFDEGGLTLGVFRQRLFTCLVLEELRARLPGSPRMERSGDDLYVCDDSGVGRRKLTISIATRSAVSSLLHFALNISTDKVPVPAAGLGEWGIDPEDFATSVGTRFLDELQSIHDARCQVRAKGEHRS